MVEVTRVDYIRVPVDDIDAATHFYGEVLGLPRNTKLKHDDWIEFEASNVTLAVMTPTTHDDEFATLPPSTIALGWDMDPRCATGACSVTWKDVTRTGFAGTFARKGATYSGSDSGQFGARCGSSNIASTLTISFHVTRAAPMFAAWRADETVRRRKPSRSIRKRS